MQLPEGCGYHPFSPIEIKQLLQNRRVCWLGDSVAMNLHDAFYSILFDTRPNAMTKWREAYDGQWWKDPHGVLSPDGSNITLIWDDRLKTCDMQIGNTFGLWALSGKTLGLETALESYRVKVKNYVTQFCDSPQKLILWLSTTALVDARVHVDPKNELPSMYDANVPRVNAIEKEELSKRQCANIVYIDAYSVSKARADCTQDGRHYITEEFHKYDALLAVHVEHACCAMGNALLWCRYMLDLVANAVDQWRPDRDKDMFD